jgi:hypothetical protein
MFILVFFRDREEQNEGSGTTEHTLTHMPSKNAFCVSEFNLGTTGLIGIPQGSVAGYTPKMCISGMQLPDLISSTCVHSIGSRDTSAAAALWRRTAFSQLVRKRGRPPCTPTADHHYGRSGGGGKLPRVENRTADTCPRFPQIRGTGRSVLRPCMAFLITTNPLHNGMRRAWRALTFWGRVAAIWGTFKITQVRVALLRASRGEAWVHNVWKIQHEKAGDVRGPTCSSFTRDKKKKST